MDDRLQRLADLLVEFGANVQPDQIVAVSAEVGAGKDELVQAAAASAYRRGAKFVDVFYFDPRVKRARIQYAAEETLDFVPSWYGERLLELGRQRCARIGLAGPAAPGLLNDLDQARVGRDQLPHAKEIHQLVSDRTTNWTIGPCPTPEWARLVHPELAPAEALEQLWAEVLHVTRLDEPDPIAAWEERVAVLTANARRLTERHFDALHFEGPGTNLTIGLFPTHAFWAADFETVDGIRHMPNLPTEEVFTCPDPGRAEGVVTSTKPLLLGDGTVVRDLVVRFEGGQAVEITASDGEDALRGRARIDPGAARLGEVALVDGNGRIGPMETVFWTTLIDENAASHIALGNGFDFVLGEDDAARRNHSAVHIDFMIGSDDVAVTGITDTGERVPLLREGSWQI